MEGPVHVYVHRDRICGVGVERPAPDLDRTDRRPGNLEVTAGYGLPQDDAGHDNTPTPDGAVRDADVGVGAHHAHVVIARRRGLAHRIADAVGVLRIDGDHV